MAAPKSTEPRGRYIHGTSASERHPLAALNQLTNEQFAGFLAARAARRILENDIGAMRYDPPSDACDEGWTDFAELQCSIDGDGRIGSKLFRMLRSAGYRDLELSIQPEVHWAGSPGFEGWIDNQIGNLRGAADALIESALVSRARIEQASADLEALKNRVDASAIFYWNRGDGKEVAG